MPEPEYSVLQEALTPRLTRYIPHAPTPPQTAFLLLSQLEAFYGGAAGGGKSDALLMAALQYVDVPGYSALVLRRTFPELSQPGAIMSRSHEWLGQWRKHGVAWNEQRKRWTFPGDATVTFGYLRSIRDVYQYQGAEFQFVGFDELTQFPEDPYTYLFSRLRRPDQGPLSEVPLRMRAASNPGNIGHGWVKKRLVVPEARDHGRVFIPAKLSDNPHLDRATYTTSLSHLPAVTQAQLLDGDWGAFEGAAYPHFDDALHVLPSMTIPHEWARFECMDFGVSNPTAWYPVATDYDGNLIVFDEQYAPGLPTDTAPLILAKRKQGWEAHDQDGWKVTSNVVWADPSTRNRAPIAGRFGNQTSVAQEFADLGVPLTPANNDRVAGFLRIAELLKPDPERRFPHWHPDAGKPGCPRIFFADCPNLIDQLKTALLEGEGKRWAGEAVDGDWESQHGHGHAALRYGVLSRPGASREPEQELDDPRAALIQRRMKQRLKPAGDPGDYLEL